MPSSRIFRLEAANVKRLRAVTITPQGNVVVIGGANGNGKSSVLDSIAMALGGGDEALSVPVRTGEKKATIVLDLGDLVVKRTFTAAGGTSLIVENKEGARYPSPQAILDALTGKLMFDPLAFTRLDCKKQLAALQKIVGLDFTATDAKRKALYEERTALNKAIFNAETKTDDLPHHPDAPAEPVDTSKLMGELSVAEAHNRVLTKLEAERWSADQALQAGKAKIVAVDAGIADLEAQIKKLQDRLAASKDNRTTLLAAERELDSALGIAQRAVEEFTKMDTDPIRAAIADASAVNAKVQANKVRADALAALAEQAKKADALTAALVAIDAEKESQIAAAPFPVAGLGFGEHGVTYNGVPFEQSSSAEQLRISVAMAAALNPKLRVMLVRDGSLLDAKSLTLLGDLAEKHDLQVWVERVSEGAECQIIIEDGAVREAPIFVNDPDFEVVDAEPTAPVAE